MCILQIGIKGIKERSTAMERSKLKTALAAAVLMAVVVFIGFGSIEANAGGTFAGQTYECVKYEINDEEQELGARAGQQLIFSAYGTYVLTGYQDLESGETVPDEKGTYTESESGVILMHTYEAGSDLGTLDLESEYVKDGDCLIYSGKYSRHKKKSTAVYITETRSLTYRLKEEG
jgi:hypothetical protein